MLTRLLKARLPEGTQYLVDLVIDPGTFAGLQETSPEFRELVRLGDLST